VAQATGVVVAEIFRLYCFVTFGCIETVIAVLIKSRRMRWAGHVARMGETRNAYRILVGKPQGKRPLGRRRRRWVDNIKMDLGEIGMGW
jgi:hypothetical protein